MKPTPIATPVKAFEAIAPATNLKPITNNLGITVILTLLPQLVPSAP